MPAPGGHADKEYTVSVSADRIEDAVSEVASALYTLIEEALEAHEGHECEECPFEDFARDVLGVLTRHADQLTPADADFEDDEAVSIDE
jgi:hypothetical protein